MKSTTIGDTVRVNGRAPSYMKMHANVVFTISNVFSISSINELPANIKLSSDVRRIVLSNTKNPTILLSFKERSGDLYSPLPINWFSLIK